MFQVPELAEEFPKLRIAIEHIGAPRISKGYLRTHGTGFQGSRTNFPSSFPDMSGFFEWKSLMSSASSHQNVFCKISGLVQLCRETEEPNFEKRGKAWSMEMAGNFTMV